MAIAAKQALAAAPVERPGSENALTVALSQNSAGASADQGTNAGIDPESTTEAASRVDRDLALDRPSDPSITVIETAEPGAILDPVKAMPGPDRSVSDRPERTGGAAPRADAAKPGGRSRSRRRWTILIAALSVTGLIAAGVVFILDSPVSASPVSAWGWGDSGQLGNGSTTDSATPVRVSNLTGVSSIAGGVFHGYALLLDGTVMAWGSGQDGALGNGTGIAGSSSATVPVSGLTEVTAMAAGRTIGYALMRGSSVMAWGRGVGLALH